MCPAMAKKSFLFPKMHLTKKQIFAQVAGNFFIQFNWIFLKVGSQLEWPNKFEMFWNYFLLKKENYPIFAFVQSLFSTNKSLKVVNLPLTNETLLEFFMSQTAQMAFPIFKVIIW